MRFHVHVFAGLTGEDLETGDPMFVVPLYTPLTNQPHTYSLCYEIHGEKDETYNFISDECTQVQAHYYEATSSDTHVQRPFHAVDHITVTAVNNMQQCVRVTVSLTPSSCSTLLSGSMLIGNYLSHGVSVRKLANGTRISVPNCADNRLIMNIFCRNLDTLAPYLEFTVVRGLNLKESSHGLIGMCELFVYNVCMPYIHVHVYYYHSYLICNAYDLIHTFYSLLDRIHSVVVENTLNHFVIIQYSFIRIEFLCGSFSKTKIKSTYCSMVKWMCSLQFGCRSNTCYST